MVTGMFMTAFSVYFICSLFPLLPMAAKAAHNARKGAMTQVQAVSLPRPKAARAPSTTLIGIREVKPLPPLVAFGGAGKVRHS